MQTLFKGVACKRVAHPEALHYTIGHKHYNIKHYNIGYKNVAREIQLLGAVGGKSVSEVQGYSPETLLREIIMEFVKAKLVEPNLKGK